MQIDFNAIKAAADNHAAESKQAFNDSLQAMREKREAKNDEIYQLLSKTAEKESESNRQEMEQKIQEEIAAASEAIRAKYEKETPAEWNEGKYAKALKQFVKNLNE